MREREREACVQNKVIDREALDSQLGGKNQ